MRNAQLEIIVEIRRAAWAKGLTWLALRLLTIATAYGLQWRGGVRGGRRGRWRRPGARVACEVLGDADARRSQ